MKQVKIIVALVTGLFAFTSAQAGEMVVTGSMHATYQTEVDDVTGNPLGMNTDLTFTGTTDTDFGEAKWTMGTDGTFVGDAGADHKLTLATGYGTFKVGNSGDSANAVDDITPTAFEEANGAGSGTYSADIGSGLEGSMSLGYNMGDIMGTGVSVDYTYYPQLDGTLNNEKGASGTQTNANAIKGSVQSINVGLPLAGIQGVGDSIVGGTKITLGYEKADSLIDNQQAKEGGTVAVVVPVGPLKVGFQKKGYQNAGTAAGGDHVWYKDEIYGIAYAINDDLAVSYNMIESLKGNKAGATGNVEQETKAINLAYTVGGLTLAFQDAKTDNAGYVNAVSDDTRTISIKTAF